MTVLLEKCIKGLLLANSKLARLDAGVVHTQEGVNIVHGLCADVGKLLNLGGSILDLDIADRLANGTRCNREIRRQTSASVSERPSCSTRDLTAFQPVRRCLIARSIHVRSQLK